MGGISMLNPVSRALAIVVGLVLAVPAAAEMTLSSSNNPTVELDARLSSLIGAETKTLKSVRGRGMSRLIEAPDPPRKTASLYSRATIDSLPKAKGDDEWSCLTEALYFEARGEALPGIFAVAEVVLNRVDDARYPSTVCGVVHQGTGERFRCQFTFTCDGRPEVMQDSQSRRFVGKVARLMLDGAPRLLTGGATHYHTRSVLPKWARVFPRTAAIGFHYFYREPDRMASR